MVKIISRYLFLEPAPLSQQYQPRRLLGIAVEQCAGRSPGGIVGQILAWAVGFFFGNTELSLELWNVIAGISGLDD